MRIRTTAVMAAAAVAVLAGCSSSGSSSDDATAPATTASSGQTAAPAAADDGEAALTAAVKAYSAAYFKPDPGAGYRLLSARCQRQTTADVYGAEVRAAVATYGHQQVQAVTVDQIGGDMARVTYTYTVPALTQTGQPWVREGGAWRYDAC
jgi:hypothetical protein